LTVITLTNIREEEIFEEVHLLKNLLLSYVGECNKYPLLLRNLPFKEAQGYHHAHAQTVYAYKTW